jgi:glycine/D-amino acid oxidase-like deaminating enzyme
MPPSLAAPAVAALADVQFAPFWTEAAPESEPCPPLDGSTTADLAVVGAGYTGLWTALLAKEADPSRDVVVLESRTAGWAASGRNGGFCAASLTHGLRNGLERFPTELGVLERLGRENLEAIGATLLRHGIDCSWERTGELTVATAPWQLDALRDLPELARSHGGELELLDAAQVRARVDSPTYVGGLLDRQGVAMVDPAGLARGLKQACLRLGVRIHENSPVTSVDDERADLGLHTSYGVVTARRVALGTNAFPPLLRRLRAYIAPVYDYALVTEPLTADQLVSVGWQGREGLADAGNQFHYYRLTPDNRILWGGYDAVYHFGNKVADRLDRDHETFARLSEHFFATFPQLHGLRFTHAWGGVIDTCSRFCVFWGRAYGGRLAYAAGYTGLGVGASRFGARVMLDLLDQPPGHRTELTGLSMVRSKPLPFPPEPVRWAGIELTRRAMARADRRDGRRGPWLRTLDRIGMGFDS